MAHSERSAPAYTPPAIIARQPIACLLLFKISDPPGAASAHFEQ